jgi:hypothetical protein
MPKKCPEFARGSAAMAAAVVLGTLSRPEGVAALQACVLLYVLLSLGAPLLAVKPQSKQTQQIVLVKRIAMCRALATMCTSSLSTAVLSSALGTAATKKCKMRFTATDAFMHTDVIVLLS